MSLIGLFTNEKEKKFFNIETWSRMVLLLWRLRLALLLLGRQGKVGRGGRVAEPPVLGQAGHRAEGLVKMLKKHFRAVIYKDSQ